MNKEDFPLVLQAKHISQILGISERRAYEIMEEEGFPLKRIGVRKYVARDKFFDWFDNQAS